MKIEIYIPVLIKFLDDGVVFKDKELDDISRKVYANFIKNESSISRRNHLDYFFKKETIEILAEKLAAHGLNIKTKDITGEFYYYHHRIIIKFAFNVAMTSMD